MAYTVETPIASRSLFERALEKIAQALYRMAERHAQRRLMRQTLNELSGLNDRDLADIGTSRAGMVSKAFEATRRG